MGGKNRVVGAGVTGAGLDGVGVARADGVRGARTGVTPVDGGGAPVDGGGAPVGWGVWVGPNRGGTSEGANSPGEPDGTGDAWPLSVTGLRWLIELPKLS